MHLEKEGIIMACENYLIQSVEAENTLFECLPAKSTDSSLMIHLLLFVKAICYLGCVAGSLACYFESCWLRPKLNSNSCISLVSAKAEDFWGEGRKLETCV